MVDLQNEIFMVNNTVYDGLRMAKEWRERCEYVTCRCKRKHINDFSDVEQKAVAYNENHKIQENNKTMGNAEKVVADWKQ